MKVVAIIQARMGSTRLHGKVLLDLAGEPMLVRDVDRLRRAMHGVDIVVHAAALKQVPTCEYNPIEAIMTNVMGAKNVIDAALDSGVKKVMALSTDKAVNPVNLYGASKLCAEKLFVPKIPSMNIMDLAQAIAPGCHVEQIGIRPGEKLHEVLISEDEARHTLELDDMYVVQPAHPWWSGDGWKEGWPPADGFRDGSDNNTQWLKVDELRAFVKNLG